MSDNNELPPEVEEAIAAKTEWLFAIGEKVSEAILNTIRSELISDGGEALRIRGADLLYVLGFAIVDIANRWATWFDLKDEMDAKPDDPD